jgi:hypothetical protein
MKGINVFVLYDDFHSTNDGSPFSLKRSRRFRGFFLKLKLVCFEMSKEILEEQKEGGKGIN